LSREVIDAIVLAAEPPKGPQGGADTPNVLGAIQAMFFHFPRAASFLDAMEVAIGLAPAGDELPALMGAFMGARLGRSGIPETLRNLVLSCRPMEGLAAHPRPPVYWGTDAMAMAEGLLSAR
jgi:hypothetical protein